MTSRALIVPSIVVVLSCASASVVSAGPAQQTTITDFDSAGPKAKKAILNDLAVDLRHASPAELVAICRAGLADPEVEIRRSALAAITGRAGILRFKNSPEVRQRSAEERPQLMELEPDLLAVLRDSDPFVRRDAIVALGNLAFDPQKPGDGIELAPSVLARFADQYARDPSPIVRGEIIKDMALGAGDRDIRERTLTAALDDSSPSVLQFAVRGIGELRIAPAMYRLQSMLYHSAREVRLAAALAFAQFGAEAKPFLPQLRTAAAAESDDVVKRTIDGSIVAIEKKD